MTTLREHLEEGTFDEPLKEFFNKHKGSIPLCCHEMKRTNGEWLITCTWLKSWYPLDKFREKCLECQKEIEGRLKMNKKRKKKIYCLFWTCKKWDSCKHNDYIVAKEKMTLEEAKKKYPEETFCQDWEQE